MIGQASFVRYIHEPLNAGGHSCCCGAKFDYRYYYLTSKNVHKFYEHLKHTIYPAYTWIGFLNFMAEVWSSKRIRSSTNYLQSHLFYKPLVKDPTAIFSAGTLAELFQMDVVVLIRHPAAVVNSYKALSWKVPFLHFLHQPELMERHLSGFRPEIEGFVKNEYDVVDQVALLWKLIHHMIIKYRETQPNWLFVRYEDLASNPIEGFRSMFDQLRLPFTARNGRIVQAHNSQHLLRESTDPYALRQRSDAAISKWQKNLTAAEICRIRERVESVSSIFYAAADWDMTP